MNESKILTGMVGEEMNFDFVYVENLAENVISGWGLSVAQRDRIWEMAFLERQSHGSQKVSLQLGHSMHVHVLGEREEWR
jgi:hypothetical protein